MNKLLGHWTVKIFNMSSEKKKIGMTLDLSANLGLMLHEVHIPCSNELLHLENFRIY
jgi:hypothetical protein